MWIVCNIVSIIEIRSAFFAHPVTLKSPSNSKGQSISHHKKNPLTIELTIRTTIAIPNDVQRAFYYKGIKP